MELGGSQQRYGNAAESRMEPLERYTKNELGKLDVDGEIGW